MNKSDLDYLSEILTSKEDHAEALNGDGEGEIESAYRAFVMQSELLALDAGDTRRPA